MLASFCFKIANIQLFVRFDFFIENSCLLVCENLLFLTPIAFGGIQIYTDLEGN